MNNSILKILGLVYSLAVSVDNAFFFLFFLPSVSVFKSLSDLLSPVMERVFQMA